LEEGTFHLSVHELDERNPLKTSHRIARRHAAVLTVSIAGLAGLAAWNDPQDQNDEPLYLARLWTAFGGGPQRLSHTLPGDSGPSSIVTPRWIKNGDDFESFEFYGQGGVVTTDELVIVVGYQAESSAGSPQGPDTAHAEEVPGVGGLDGPATGWSDAADPDPLLVETRGQDALVAFSRIDGSVAWSRAVPIAALDSWSTPCVDVLHDTLVIAAGSRVIGASLADGTTRWSTPLGRIVVNASPVVTHDLGPRNRAFITDHSFASGVSGRLYCLNTSPFHPTLNPHQPGDLLWSVALDGQTSGNTPSYKDGVVYVSTATGGGTWDQGTVRAFPADASAAPAPLWVYHHTDPSGFFAGVAIKGQSVYASTYSFHGDQFSAATVKLDRHTGQQLWSVPTNRTDTVPVPLGSGFVLVSGGVPFTSMFSVFGSLPSIQLIYEQPWGGAVRLWDSAIDTLDDANGNGTWDPGETFLSVGNWTSQPIVVELPDGRPAAYVASAPDPALDGFYGSGSALSLIDLTKHPAHPDFVIATSDDCGGSPALVGSELYAAGRDGLYAFGAPSWPRAVVLARWANRTLPDLNGNGVLDGFDFQIALREARD
tara:strand:- start:16844 stop:18634 length:1791 start_codon:yes stop_codon:yes gene_type:complete